jgi:hypothetical protein
MEVALCGPLVAHCHLGLGKLYRRTGKHEQAREQLGTATTMYREKGMTYWLEKAEAPAGESGPGEACVECAAPVGGPGRAPRFASPRAYTPKHLAERIVDLKRATEGDRKHLCCDSG